jgi:dihydroorotate dehydrogenase (NAD+) catalytic subunit
MAIDIQTRKPRLANVRGGLSGPAIKPIAVRMVYEVKQAVKIPIIGLGGIMNSDDAIEFIIAGATAVAVGTANFVNPRATMEILDGITEYMTIHKIKDIGSLTGTVNVP